MLLLRIIVFTILLCLLAILAYPLAIIYDFARGGTGYGLCSELTICYISFSEGPKLYVQLVGIFFLLIGLLRICMHVQNYLTK